MPTRFQIEDPSIESQWRAIILFGKNSATYKFAFAKSLLSLVENQKTRISLSDLAIPFAESTVEHLRIYDKQGSSSGSAFLNACRDYIHDKITQDQLYELTQKHGFNYVIDAFQVVNGAMIPDKLYEKNFGSGSKEIVITDNLLKLKELFQYRNLSHEVEARWKLVETAWNLQIIPTS